jgi:N utilization substance protein A
MTDETRKRKANREKKERTAKPVSVPDTARPNSSADEDADGEMNLDRLRALTKHEPGNPRKLEKEIFKLDASTEEEVDALKVNLLQEDEHPRVRDGSGHVVDEVAEEKMARFTEVGPLLADRGAESVTPGRDDTSKVLRRHHPNTGIVRAEDVVEGNLEEPREEGRGERKVDKDTAA